ncbi:MAG: hypothetical protein JWP44_1405 [Mucilaginibacter sp.]|nr:hypothetical protein [Mucilaginibacter sp.]
MGDLIMNGPALRALKVSFDAKITVLTSSMAAGIVEFMPEIDEVMVYDLPWVKTTSIADSEGFIEIITKIKERKFDAAVIFTVYSQNPLPSVMLAYLAGIPKRLAYCRENPYQLLTHWVPDKEPYTVIKHQVRRDLELAATVGAYTPDEELILKTDESIRNKLQNKLIETGINIKDPWLIIHPGVSETKRGYTEDKWIAAAKKIINELGFQVLFTGSGSEKALTQRLQEAIGEGSYSLGGILNLGEFITLIGIAPVVLSVNTATVHIAAATGTPVVVLYALTNPQHTPWKVPCKVLPFQVPVEAHSRNEVIRYVNDFFYREPVELPCESEVFNAAKALLGLSANENNLITAVNLKECAINPLPVQIPVQNPPALTS